MINTQYVKNIIDQICKQLKDFMGDKKAIIGISGGIDSAVIASLSVKALGKNNVLGILMPYRDQSVQDSKLVIESLNIPWELNNIVEPVESFSMLGNGKLDKLTLGNIMARVRMVILYMYSNKYNGIVVGTTNKTEAKIGYYTKYGDGAVDVEPIADLYKTEVRMIAKELKVPQVIIDKAPSAELWGGQTDEDELGITYEKLDSFFMDRDAFNSDQISLGGLITDHGINKINIIEKLVRNSEHKRHMPPAFIINNE